MLKSLKLTNFRAFKSVGLEFSKLNIFLGPNNSGKSSIISAINLIAQNAKPGRRAGGFTLNGAYSDLGTFYDVVYAHKPGSRFGLEFTVENYRYEYQFRYRLQRREIEITRATISDGENRYTYRTTKDGASHDFHIKGLGKIIGLNKARPRIFGLTLVVPYSVMMDIESQSADRGASSAVRRFFVRGLSGLEQEFNNFDSIGAFRAPPQRTYLYSGESPQDVGRAGENFAQMLASGSSSRERSLQLMVGRVSNWLKNSGIGNGLEIRSLTNRHFEICVEDRLGMSSNIVDAGFGCSQVLPVIIGGYKLASQPHGPSGGIFVVQEPEIHLHPIAAAHLGTYFADLTRRNIQSFVETHSENLVLRVARHISLGHLKPEDVRIFWVGDKNGERHVTLLEVRSDGTFADEWPEGFFPTRSSETLELARSSSNLPTTDQLELSLDG